MGQRNRSGLEAGATGPHTVRDLRVQRLHGGAGGHLAGGRCCGLRGLALGTPLPATGWSFVVDGPFGACGFSALLSPCALHSDRIRK